MKWAANKRSHALLHKLALQLEFQLGQTTLRIFKQRTYIWDARVDARDNGCNICSGSNGANVRILHAETKWQCVVNDFFFRKLMINPVTDGPQQVIHIQERANDARTLLPVLPGQFFCLCP